MPFVNSFKTSGDWVSCTEDNCNDGRRLDLDERGWVKSLKPGQVALTVLVSDIPQFRGTLARRWVVEYEGTGTLEYGEQARLVEQGNHRDLIKLEEGKGNATITLTSTDPNDYIRNIRVTPEGNKSKSDELFNPIFLEKLKGYRALRFMIWMLGESTDDIAARRWNERPTPQDARWTIKGAPVEIMVALANRVHADPWFSIPHGADDYYVRHFAETVRESLDPILKVYIEYSNEVWNDVYPQTIYAREKGLALGLSHDPGEAAIRYYAKRATEIFAIWEKVFPKERLVRVLSFQSDGSPEYSDEVALSFGETRKHVDALAIGPYFGTELGADDEGVDRIRKMDLDQLMKELENSYLPKAKEQMLAHASVTRKYGLPMIAYEGGQHLWNMSGKEDRTVTALFHRANRDPRMGSLYARYLQDWAVAGGGLFMHLLDCSNTPDAGNWGALEYINQPRAQAPKYDALMQFIEEQGPR